MATPFLSEIVMVSFDFAPRGYALCNGQLLPINQNQALFSLLGTTFGGDGRVNFGLPNLQGRIPMHWGAGHVLGEKVGTETVTLNINNMPDHSHPVQATLQQPVGAAATELSPKGALPAISNAASPAYSNKADDQMSVTSLSQMVADPVNLPLKTETNLTINGAYNNMMPSLTINYIIALQGVFPSQT